MPSTDARNQRDAELRKELEEARRCKKTGAPLATPENVVQLRPQVDTSRNAA